MKHKIEITVGTPWASFHLLTFQEILLAIAFLSLIVISALERELYVLVYIHDWIDDNWYGTVYN